jgi:hypothetical protein
VFTARNRQNPFAKRRREQREAEAEIEHVPVAVPVDLNPDSEEYTQAPDISTYATGGIVGQAVIGEPSPYPYEPVPEETKAADELSQLGQDIEAEMSTPQHIAIPVFTPELQAKIEAVANRAIPSVAEPETPQEDEPKRGRGRPRPQETIDRDNAVHALLVGADPETGISKESIAAELDEKEQQVYSSLRQLSKEGRAENRYVKPHGYRWFAA